MNRRALSRLSSLALLVILLLALATGAFWYFAYAINPEPPSRVRVEGLQDSVTIGWTAEGYATIAADNREDEYAALGYVHGLRSAWPLVLWRETALGRIGETLHIEARELDALARRLGFGTLAKQSYEQMREQDRVLLNAYVSGINAALDREIAGTHAPFSLLNIDPRPWQPYHTLALERLLAWLSTPPLHARGRGIEATTSAAHADSLLRQWMHIHGFDRSIAWSGTINNESHLFSRQAYGSSALPFLQSVSFQRPDSTFLLGASLPGTPFFLYGMTAQRAWTIMPGGTYQVGFTTGPTRTSHERIITANGDEFLVRIDRPAAGLQLGVGAGGRRRLTLQWAGLDPGTDWSSWRLLMEGGTPAFQLIEGDGLLLSRSGTQQVIGDPQYVVPFQSGLAVSNSPWAEAVAMRLDTLAQQADTMTAVADWQRDCTSAWAEQQTGQLLAAVDSLSGRVDLNAPTRQAISYLENWDYSYENVSIGASIYEMWALTYRRQQGHLPGLRALRSDTVAAGRLYSNFRRVQLLQAAVAELTDALGNDISTWRWERMHSEMFYFPVWSRPFSGARDLPASNRYAPIELSGFGHPSTPCGGTTFATEGAPASASWEGWVETGSWGTLHIQRRRFETDRFLGRYRTSDRPPSPVTFEAFADPPRTTTLVPVSQ